MWWVLFGLPRTLRQLVEVEEGAWSVSPFIDIRDREQWLNEGIRDGIHVEDYSLMRPSHIQGLVLTTLRKLWINVIFLRELLGEPLQPGRIANAGIHIHESVGHQ